MARYLLVGALGGPNFGDELILLTWINIIKQRDPAAQIYCDGYNLEGLKKTVDGLAHVVDGSESLWNFCSLLDYDVKKNIWSEISKFSFNNQNLILDKLSVLAKKNIDQIHIIGGGYLNSIWKSNYFILIVSRLLSWMTGARLIATGLGLTPVDIVDLPNLRALLKTFDLVDVRDEDSYNLLSGIDAKCITYTGDDVLLTLCDDIAKLPLQKISQKSLVICLQNDLFDGDGVSEILFTTNIITLLQKHAVTNVIFAMAMMDDVSGRAGDLKSTLENHNFSVLTIEPYDLIKFGFPISEGGIIITSRYHPHFLSALSGAAGLAISSISYYDTKHEAVCTMGGNWRVLNFTGDIQGGGDKLHEAIEEALSDRCLTYRDNDRNRFIQMKKALMEHALNLHTPRIEFPVDFIGLWSGTNEEIGEKLHIINEIKSKLINKENYLTGLEIELKNYKNTIQKYNDEIKQLKLEVLELSNLNQNIRESFSWRITSPMRWVYSFFK